MRAKLMYMRKCAVIGFVNTTENFISRELLLNYRKGLCSMAFINNNNNTH